jgi:MFS family permease
MSTELGWSNAATALAFSISAIMEGLFNIILGHLTDKYGPRVILTISSLFIGAGYCLMPMVHSVWQFYLFYGVILGAGMGGVFVPLISVVARWFRERRSAMCGLVSAGSGIGMLVVSPLATQLILTHGWRTTFLFAVIVGLAAGGMGALMSPLVASLFGLRSLGLIFGFCGFCCTIGQACGPYITGVVLDRTQNFQIALGVCVVAAIIGLFAIIFLKPVKIISVK